MRKIVVIEFITLDGVIQGPGGPEEDTSGGFEFGGWIAPFQDDQLFAGLQQQIDHPFDLLLGRFTYDIWVNYWPHQPETEPFAGEFKRATKYVVSHRPLEPDWPKSVLIQGDIEEELLKIKAEDGPELQVYGSANMIQTLMKHDLVDEYRLMIYPITLGKGKKLFDEGTIPANFKLAKGVVTDSGVIIAQYQRNGDVQTGDVT